jgi:probable HAF family extracellular repeat protein
MNSSGIPFLYKDSTHVYSLGTMPATMDGSGHAIGINNNGTVVGYGEVTTAISHAFVWTPDTPNGTTGTMVDLNSLGLLPADLASAGWYFQYANAINDSGSIVGSLYNNSTNAQRAFTLIAVPAPEPSTLLLVATGLLGLLAYAWRKRK